MCAQVWDMPWVQRTVHEAAYGGDMGAALQLWLWLQREGWGLIPGARLDAARTLRFTQREPVRRFIDRGTYLSVGSRRETWPCSWRDPCGTI
jgi:hypothetical protein